MLDKLSHREPWQATRDEGCEALLEGIREPHNNVMSWASRWLPRLSDSYLWKLLHGEKTLSIEKLADLLHGLDVEKGQLAVINAVNPALMQKIIFGQTLAVVYGFGLIIFAFILAIIYNQFCTAAEKRLNQ